MKGKIHHHPNQDYGPIGWKETKEETSGITISEKL